jgi:uncharacterized protein YwqG
MKRKQKEFHVNWSDNATSGKQSRKPFGPLREYRIKFDKAPRGGKVAIDTHKLGARSKLGGEPDWVQNPEIPKCRECKQPMTFVAQIDSMEHDESYNPHAVNCLSGQQHYMFGDVGMIYVFLCFECMATKSVVQYG